MIWLLILLLTAGTAPPALADLKADKEEITSQLTQWVTAFNARDAAGACDIFAANLISTVPGALDAGRDAVCARLAALLAKSDRQMRYSLSIQEILVSGDLAVVRLDWTLNVKKKVDLETMHEAGLDIFQRQVDGKWSIIRFMAFPANPEP
jgi:uncharacterized protein (TIGR02246 family)